VFSDPAVATVGLDPEAATRAGQRARVARRPWNDQGRAPVIDQTDGVAQLVVDASTRKILGCQLVGPLAEMIPSLARAIIRDLDGSECGRGDVAPCPEMQ
jgi:dihydrolipoyl dehydrogenase